MKVITYQEWNQKYEALRDTLDHECEQARQEAHADGHSVPDAWALRKIENAEKRFEDAVDRLHQEFTWE